jgi:hypothetical protein
MGTGQVPNELYGKLKIQGAIPMRYIKKDPTQNVPDCDDALSIAVLGGIAFLVLSLKTLARCRKDKSSQIRIAPNKADRLSPSSTGFRSNISYPFL